MATDTAPISRSRLKYVPIRCALEPPGTCLAGNGRPLPRHRQRYDSRASVEVRRVLWAINLRRAHERQQPFTWHQVKSVANIAAFVSPVAFVSQVSQHAP